MSAWGPIAADGSSPWGPVVLDATMSTLPGALFHTGSTAGFFGATPTTKPAVTGSRGGNAALASLLTQLANLGLIVDSSS